MNSRNASQIRELFFMGRTGVHIVQIKKNYLVHQQKNYPTWSALCREAMGRRLCAASVVLMRTQRGFFLMARNSLAPFHSKN